MSTSERACTSVYSCDANMADHWWCFLIFFLFSFQNAGEGPTEHVQKGATADRLYGVSLGTTDQCIITQKPHRYTACISHCGFSTSILPRTKICENKWLHCSWGLKKSYFIHLIFSIPVIAHEKSKKFLCFNVPYFPDYRPHLNISRTHYVKKNKNDKLHI